MSTMIQPNGMPGRSFLPKPTQAQREEIALLRAASSRNRKTFDGVREAIQRRLRAGEITVAEAVKARNRADREQVDADLVDHRAIREARRPRVARAA